MTTWTEVGYDIEHQIRLDRNGGNVDVSVVSLSEASRRLNMHPRYLLGLADGLGIPVKISGERYQFTEADIALISSRSQVIPKAKNRSKQPTRPKA